MSSPVFVLDAQGTPLMPTSAAYARRLLQRGKARWVPHHAFPIIQLTQIVTSPALRPVVTGIHIHLHTAELFVVADGERGPFPLLHLVVDLRTDLPIRLRRRAGHRRRRRARGRYRPMRRHGQPFKLRRPSMARSAWGRAVRPRLRRTRGSRPWSISPTMRWRAQAITRVISALKQFLPLSHAFILSPANMAEPNSRESLPTILRQQLIDTYGQLTSNGHRIAMCAYCGTTEGIIEVDHIVPVDRGGTDAWNNRVLACSRCNACKGNRTPEEAGMPILVPSVDIPIQPNRAGVYARWTARSLVAQLEDYLSIIWYQPDQPCPRNVSKEVFESLKTFTSLQQTLSITVAKPIMSPIKQIFSARNYPLSTPLTTGFVLTKQTIKRRIQVNSGLAIARHTEQRRIKVIPAGTTASDETTQVVRLGMLCEAKRNGETFKGIVAAIHSTGRLTLLRLDAVRGDHINWRRVVVSPQQHLRVLSTDRIVFVQSPPPASDTRGWKQPAP